MWEIRRASLADKAALIELCQAAAGPDDYPIEAMEEMILRGVWHVALDEDQIVGALHYRDAIDGSGWLGAARTHPAFRRQGVAAALIESFAGLARRTRVSALRLWSSASNVDGTSTVRASGFREVARFTRVRRGTAKPAAPTELVAFGDATLARVEGSSVLRSAGGYVPYESYFVPLIHANVHLLCNKFALHQVGGGIACLSESPEGGERVMESGLVAGSPAKVLGTLPQVGRGRGFAEVHAFVPHNPAVLRAATRAGFRRESWGQEAVLYERSIELGPPSYRKRPTYAEIAAGKREGLAALGRPGGHGHKGPHEDRWNG